MSGADISIEEQVKALQTILRDAKYGFLATPRDRHADELSALETILSTLHQHAAEVERRREAGATVAKLAVSLRRSIAKAEEMANGGIPLDQVLVRLTAEIGASIGIFERDIGPLPDTENDSGR